jgi:hypothetical protein
MRNTTNFTPEKQLLSWFLNYRPAKFPCYAEIARRQGRLGVNIQIIDDFSGKIRKMASWDFDLAIMIYDCGRHNLKMEVTDR